MTYGEIINARASAGARAVEASAALKACTLAKYGNEKLWRERQAKARQALIDANVAHALAWAAELAADPRTVTDESALAALQRCQRAMYPYVLAKIGG